MGDWVTGKPVRILRYAANFDNRIKAFVREAFGDLIAVDSSTARSALDDRRTASRNFGPLPVLKASTFMTSIRKPSAGRMNSTMSFFKALVGLGRQIKMGAPSATLSGMCAGISSRAQLR